MQAWDLSEVLSNLSDNDRFDLQQPAEWLRIAAGLKSIEVDFSRYDTSSMYCPTDEEWDAEQNGFYQRTVFELTKFNFAWGAFEFLTATLLAGRTIPIKGKVNRVCFWLKNEYDREFPVIAHYDPYCSLLISRIKGLQSKYDDLKDVLNPKDHVGPSGLGIYLVYRVRNHFAHGSLKFSERPEGDLEKSTVGLVHASTHIIFLTIQMMLANWRLQAPETYSALMEAGDYPEEWSLSDIILNLHCH